MEGIFHPTTVASVAIVITVNELLLREGDKFISGEEVSTFQSSGG